MMARSCANGVVVTISSEDAPAMSSVACVPEMAADEWAAPFRPGARTVAAAIADAVRAGSRSFAGAGAATAARYVGRVAAFAAPWANAWDDADGRPVSLVAHFGGALARWAVR